MKKGFKPYTTVQKSLQKKGLHSKGIEKLSYNLASNITGKIPEILPQELVQQYNLISREEAYKYIHIPRNLDRKSTRLNSSHVRISYAVVCLKKKTAWTAGP